MRISRNFFGNTLVAYIGTFVLIGLGVVGKMLLARILAPGELGVFISAQIAFGMMAFLGGLSVPDAIARFVGLYSPDSPRSLEVLSRGLRLAVGFALLLTLIAVLWEWGMSAQFSRDPRYSIIGVLIALAMPFKVAADAIGAANQGAGRLYIKTAVVDVVPAIAFACGLGFLAVSGMGSLNLVAVAYVLSIALSPFLFFGAFSIRAIVRPCGASVRYGEIVRYSLPLLLSGAVAWPLTLVPIVVGRQTSAEAVSYYSLAISLGSFIYLGTAVMEAAGLSAWSSYLGRGDVRQLEDDYRLSTRCGLLVGSVVFAALSTCPRDIVALLFGARYEPIARILPYMSCIFFANLMTGPTESLLKAHGETRFILTARLTAGAVVAATLYPFLRLWGLNGAVAVYGLATIIGGVAMYSWRLYRRYRLHPIDGYFLRTLGSVAGALILAFLAHGRLVVFWGAIGAISATVVGISTHRSE